MDCFVSYDTCVHRFGLFTFFSEVLFHSRGTGSCPATTVLVVRVIERTTTTDFSCGQTNITSPIIPLQLNQHIPTMVVAYHIVTQKLMQQGYIRYGTYPGVSAVYAAGKLPVLDTLVNSGRHQYPYRKLF